jgi:hypothetical protein
MADKVLILARAHQTGHAPRRIRGGAVVDQSETPLLEAMK